MIILCIIPGRNSDARIKPLPLVNGHGRYIIVTPERALGSVGGMAVTYNRYKFVTGSLLKWLHNGRLNPETAVWRFHNLNGHLDPEVVKKIRWNLRRGRWAWL